MKTMVVLGAYGFLGQNIANKYESDYMVYRIGRGEIAKNLEWIRPDVIVNCAAEIYDESKMWESNVLYTKAILDYCAKFPVEKVILVGSSSEYGRKNHPISETDFLEPVTMYESTKAAATMLAKGYAEKHNINLTVLRPFTIVGRYEKPHKFFPTLYRKFLKLEPLQLAEGVHDFVFIDEFLMAFDAILHKKEEKNFNIINVGTGVQTTNSQIVEAFEEALNHKYKIERASKMRSFDSECWVANPGLLLTKYGVDAKINLVDGVKKFIADCERNKLYNE